MSRLFKRLPGQVPTPAGAERVVLRGLPRILLIGTLLLALPPLAARLLTDMAPGLAMVDIYCVSLIVLHWTVVFTVGIGAFIVMVMKGPAYVADAYPLSDAERPG